MKDAALRDNFPFFQHPDNQSLIYFDSAATTQKPASVINTITEYYTKQNANVHRASYALAAKTTSAFELARKNLANFIGAQDKNEIVFTKGTTESINLVARALTEKGLASPGRILLSATEHHANLVPWQQMAKSLKLEIDVIPVDREGNWQIEEGLNLVTEQTRIVALGWVSNALGTINPINAFIEKAKSVSAVTLIDAAQAVAHLPINVQALDCDFLVFSGHKAYGPTGIGVLYGKLDRLNALPAFLTGGEMIETVEYRTATFLPAPFKFEAGTPNIEGVLALDTALNFISTHRAAIDTQEQKLTNMLLQSLKRIAGIRIFGGNERIATVAFCVEGFASQDIGMLLNEQGIAVRVGHHCAMPLMNTLGVGGLIRASLACYNTHEEVERFVDALQTAIANLAGAGTVKAETAKTPTEKNHIEPEYAIAQAVKSVRGWDSVYRQIMLAGKQLSRVSNDEKQPEFEVHGCESQVWLVVQKDALQRIQIRADASSKIVRGLLAILLEPVQNRSAEFVKGFDFFAHLRSLSLDKHLSESRGNGLAAVVKRIQESVSTL